MRILKIIPEAFYTTRGTPLSAYHRARELIARGHEVDILTYPIGADPPNLGVRLYRARGLQLFDSIAAGPSRPKIWFDFLLFLNLLVHLSRRRYDLLYAHEEGAFLARFAGALFRVPYVYDMHSSLPLQITDWKFSSKRWVVDLFTWIERVTVRDACAVVAISPAVERAAKKAYPNVHSIVIVNYFEMGATATEEDAQAIRERYNVPAGRKLVLYTGSFVPLQALDLLIDSVPRVLKRVDNVHFLLVGGTEAEIAELRSQARRLDVESYITFDANRPQSEMPAYLRAADVLVSPRVQGINPPGKLFSYLASGRPVVATDTLVHNQLLNDNCAILTRPDASSFADGVVTALTDSSRVKTIVAEAGQFLLRHCSKTARDQAYGALFAAVADVYASKSGRRRLESVASPDHRKSM